MKKFYIRSATGFAILSLFLPGFAASAPTADPVPVETITKEETPAKFLAQASIGFVYDTVRGAYLTLPFELKAPPVGRWRLGSRFSLDFDRQGLLGVQAAATAETDLYKGDRFRIFVGQRLGLSFLSRPAWDLTTLDLVPQLGFAYDLTSWLSVGLVGGINFKTVLNTQLPSDRSRFGIDYEMGIPIQIRF